MSEGLVLQDATIWQQFLDKDLIPKNNMTELYFEEPDIEGFVKKLEESEFKFEFVNKLMTHSWGQKVVRNGKQSTLGYQPEVWKGWN